MTSPLPPRRRDTRSVADLIRQDRQNLKQRGAGFVGGRFPPAKPLGRPFSDGEEEDDSALDPIQFLNTDTGTASGSNVAVTINLSHIPEDGSEQVYWRGLGLPRSEWSRTDTVLTIPGQHYFKAGDSFWVDYAYYDTDDAAAAALPLLVGTSQATGAISSIALPTGVQSGDLILLVSASSTVSTTDSRIVGTHQAFGPGELVAWGYADGSGTPVAVSVVPNTSGYGATVLAVYRDVRVLPPVAQNTTTGTTLAAATFPNATGALVAVLAWSGTVAGTIGNDSTGEWTTDVKQNHIKNNAMIASWHTDAATPSPAGSFLLSGDNSGFGAVTLLLEGSE